MPKNLSIPLPKEFTTLLHMSSEWLNKARQFECKLTKVVNLSMLLLLSLCLPCFRYTTIWSDYNLKSLQGHNFLIESFRDGYIFDWGFPSGSVVKNLQQCWRGSDSGSIPGSGRSPGGGINPLQYCLENFIDREAWWAMVHGVTKSWTWLKRLSTHAFFRIQNFSDF